MGYGSYMKEQDDSLINANAKSKNAKEIKIIPKLDKFDCKGTTLQERVSNYKYNLNLLDQAVMDEVMEQTASIIREN
jgi:hypothetical protein